MVDNTEWSKNWMSEVYIEAAGDVEETREHLTYDYTDLIGDIGGYLGLFLGWSLLGLTVQLFTIALDIFSRVKMA